MDKKANFVKEIGKYLQRNGVRALETFGARNIKKLTGVRDDLVNALVEESGVAQETIAGGIKTIGKDTGTIREAIENQIKSLKSTKADISSQFSNYRKEGIPKTDPKWLNLAEKQQGVLRKLEKAEPLLDEKGVRSSFKKLQSAEDDLTKAIRRRQLAWGTTGAVGLTGGIAAYENLKEDPLYHRVTRQQSDKED